MRHVVTILLALAGCAFDPQGPGVTPVDDTDAPPAADVDAASAADPDAADPDAADPDASPSTTTDAAVSLPDASLPLPDAASPPDAAPPADAGPLVEMACTNGQDDDQDGKVDCRDDDCPSCGGLSSCCPSGACALLCL